jgi:hypothetical protein
LRGDHRPAGPLVDIDLDTPGAERFGEPTLALHRSGGGLVGEGNGVPFLFDDVSRS